MHLHEVAQVELRPVSGGVADVAQVYLANILDVRSTTGYWSAASSPLYNWISVFNFHAAEGVLAFGLSCLHRPYAEALMVVRDRHIVKCDNGHRDPLVYVSFLEVAPWNQPTAVEREYQGLGPIMLRIACEFSVQRGYGGRLGLHSVAAAEAFYRRLGFESLDCPSEHHELYLEVHESRAEALLHDTGELT
jgi:hypothetical protein